MNANVKTQGWMMLHHTNFPKYLKICFSVFSILTICGLCSAQTQAKSKYKKDMVDLFDESALVANVECMEVDATQFDYEKNFPFTKVVFRVIDVLFGDDINEEITFMVPGGVYPDGSIGRYSDTPSYQAGKTYLVFFRRDNWNISPSTDWIESSFEEYTDAGEEYLIDSHGKAICDINSEGFQRNELVSFADQELEEVPGIIKKENFDVEVNEDLFEKNNGKIVRIEDPDSYMTSSSEEKVKCKKRWELYDLLDWTAHTYEESSKDDGKGRVLKYRPTKIMHSQHKDTEKE